MFRYGDHEGTLALGNRYETIRDAIDQTAVPSFHPKAIEAGVVRLLHVV